MDTSSQNIELKGSLNYKRFWVFAKSEASHEEFTNAFEYSANVIRYMIVGHSECFHQLVGFVSFEYALSLNNLKNKFPVRCEWSSVNSSLIMDYIASITLMYNWKEKGKRTSHIRMNGDLESAEATEGWMTLVSPDLRAYICENEAILPR